MAAIIQGLSDNHFKRVNLSEFEDGNIYYKNNFNRIWELKGQTKKWSGKKVYLYQRMSKNSSTVSIATIGLSNRMALHRICDVSATC
jgi:hypothetical protein